MPSPKSDFFLQKGQETYGVFHSVADFSNYHAKFNNSSKYKNMGIISITLHVVMSTTLSFMKTRFSERDNKGKMLCHLELSLALDVCLPSAALPLPTWVVLEGLHFGGGESLPPRKAYPSPQFQSLTLPL